MQWILENTERHRKLLRRKGVAILEIARCGQELCEKGASLEDIQGMQTKMRSSYREILSTRLSTVNLSTLLPAGGLFALLSCLRH